MGILSIVATPIGNLEDISLRALRALFSADVIACEDTRRAGSLLSELKKRYEPILTGLSISLDKPPTFIRYDDRTEQQSTPVLLEHLASGATVVLISDAGTPLLNDPGYILVREVRRKGIPVNSIPGASALLTALTVAGLPTDKFMYLGYPPEKQAHRVRLLESLKECNRRIEETYVFYVSPHKLTGMLEDLSAVLGNIEITFARELTKKFEEVWTGTLDEAKIRYADPKGEFVLLFRIAS
ncbi:16S rRNA (cytidine(1402)-2'-O)-methyltransferase [Candidatus Gottesmanbacteria bacterium]|nr:16S rRNA (cytidine(1402)-2'-O)-methyltransferase [Candidatus Gottesmanbacteria bacterium]